MHIFLQRKCVSILLNTCWIPDWRVSEHETRVCLKTKWTKSFVSVCESWILRSSGGCEIRKSATFKIRELILHVRFVLHRVALRFRLLYIYTHINGHSTFFPTELIREIIVFLLFTTFWFQVSYPVFNNTLFCSCMTLPMSPVSANLFKHDLTIVLNVCEYLSCSVNYFPISSPSIPALSVTVRLLCNLRTATCTWCSYTDHFSQ